MNRAPRRNNINFSWWVDAVVKVAGFTLGPLALANLLSDVIEWKGFIAYAVSWWEVHITQTFSSVFNYVLNRFGMPNISNWLTDYLAFGVIYTAGAERARQITYHMVDTDYTPYEPPSLKAAFSTQLLLLKLRLQASILTIFLILVWPLALLTLPGVKLEEADEMLTSDASLRIRRATYQKVLTLIPAIGFGILFGLNWLL